MKLNKIHKKIISILILGCLASSASMAFAGEMPAPMASTPATSDLQGLYVGIFGGDAKMSGTDFSQLGTVYFTEAVGGPLSVNVSGKSDSDSTTMWGAHVGFAWPHNMNGAIPFTTAIEVEGYAMDDIKLKGNAINNADPMRLPEHDFYDTYPLKSDVFLINAVLSMNKFEWFTPYAGIGFGSALQSISDATSTQVDPEEADINHYNSDPDDKDVAFAVQPKVGARFNINSHLHIFAEYRYLYLSATEYTFGSTVDPTHAPTSPWTVKVDPQHYNMGVVGIELSV